MLTVLFWNVQKKPLLDRVARLVTAHAVDVLVLAECEAAPADVVTALNQPGGQLWAYPASLAARLRVFTRLQSGQLVEVFNDANGRLTIREFRPAGGNPLLLAAIHFLSKFGGTEDVDQASLAQLLAEDLERIEDLRGTHRTAIVGDFNMNPFDPGLVNGFGFHAFMTRDLATRRSQRVVQSRTCRRAFFNPMWQFLTDRPGKPSGTYYRHGANPVNHYWHAFDQVLVRPELSDKLVRVDVLDHDGTQPLTVADGGWPDTDEGSDHLPVLFVLDV